MTASLTSRYALPGSTELTQPPQQVGIPPQEVPKPIVVTPPPRQLELPLKVSPPPKVETKVETPKPKKPHTVWSK